MPIWPSLFAPPKRLTCDQARRMCARQMLLPRDKTVLKQLIRDTHPTLRPALVKALEELRHWLPGLHINASVQHTCFAALAHKSVPHIQACVAALKEVTTPQAEIGESSAMDLLLGFLRLPHCDVRDTARCFKRLPPGLRVPACLNLMAPMVQPDEKVQFVAGVLRLVPNGATWFVRGPLLQFLAQLPMPERRPMAEMLRALQPKETGIAACMRLATLLVAVPAPARAQVAKLVHGSVHAEPLIAVLGNLPDAQTRRSFMEGLAPMVPRLNRIDGMALIKLLAEVNSTQRAALFEAHRQLSHNVTPCADLLATTQTLAACSAEQVDCVARNLSTLRNHGRYSVEARWLVETAVAVPQQDLPACVTAFAKLLDATPPELLRYALGHLETLSAAQWPRFTCEALAFPGGDHKALMTYLGLLRTRVTLPADAWREALAWAQTNAALFKHDVVAAVNVAKDLSPATRDALVARSQFFNLWSMQSAEAADLARCLVASLACPAGDLETLTRILGQDGAYYFGRHPRNLQALQAAGDLLSGIPPNQVQNTCAALKRYLAHRAPYSPDRIRFARAFLQPLPEDPERLARNADLLLGDPHEWGFARRAERDPGLETLPLVRRIVQSVAPAQERAFWYRMNTIVNAFDERHRFACIEQLLDNAQPHDPLVFLYAVGNLTTSVTSAYNPSAIKTAIGRAMTFLQGIPPAIAEARANALGCLARSDMDDATRYAVAETILNIAPHAPAHVGRLAYALLGGRFPDPKGSLGDVRVALSHAVQLTAGVDAILAQAQVEAMRPILLQGRTLDERLQLSTTLAALLPNPSPNLIAALNCVSQNCAPSEGPHLIRVAQDLVQDTTLAPARVEALRRLTKWSDTGATRVGIAAALATVEAPPSDVLINIADTLLNCERGSLSRAQIDNAMAAAQALARLPPASAEARLLALSDLVSTSTPWLTGVRMANMLCQLPHDPPPGFARLLGALLETPYQVLSAQGQEAFAYVVQGVLAWLDETPNAARQLDTLVGVLPREGYTDWGVEHAARVIPWLSNLPVLRLVGWAGRHADRYTYNRSFFYHVTQVDRLVAPFTPTQRAQLHRDMQLLAPGLLHADRWYALRLMAHAMGQPHYDDLVGMLIRLLEVNALNPTTFQAVVSARAAQRAMQVSTLVENALTQRNPYRHINRENVMNQRDIDAVQQAIHALQRTVPPIFNAQAIMQRIVQHVQAQRSGTTTPALQRSQRNGVREIDNAWHALTAPNGKHDYGVSILDTPELVSLCALIWKRIDMYTHCKDTNRTAHDQELMREALLIAFAQCIEDDGHRVCNVGRRARFIRVLQGYCPEIMVDAPKTSPPVLLNQLALAWRSQGNTGDDAACAERFVAKGLQRAHSLYGRGSADYTQFVQALRTYVQLSYEPLQAAAWARLGLAAR